MTPRGLRVLGVLVFVVPLACGGKVRPSADGAGVPSGGTSGSGSTGGGGGSSASDPSDGLAIRWNDQGVISSDANEFGIQGTWFFETDCADAAPEGLPCTVPDATLTGPDGQLGWSTSADRVCAKGVAAQVIDDPATDMPAYSLQWGVQLGFALNEDPTTGDLLAYDAAQRGLDGFQFDITTNGAPATVRVNIFTTSMADDDVFFVEASLPAVQVTVPFEVTCQDCLWVLDETAITAVAFQVFTNRVSVKPFDFCVSNARVVPQ